VLLAGAWLAQAGPDPLSINGDTATAQGNQANGIASGTDFATPPISTLIINALSGPIQPGSGTAGISFLNNSGGNVNIFSGLANSHVVISTSGSTGFGINAQSTGAPSGNPPIDPLLNIPIPTAANVPGGVVAVRSYSDITTTGDGAHGITVKSSTTGYPPTVLQQLTNFSSAGISFTVNSVGGAAGQVGQAVKGTLIDTNGNPIGGSAGTFTVNANGTFSFDRGNDFTNMAIGETRQVVVTYGLYGTSSTGTNQTSGTLIEQITRTATGFTNQPGVYSSQYGPSSSTTSVVPDLTSYVAGLIAAASAGGAGNSVSVTNQGAIHTSGTAAHGIFAQSIGGQGGGGSGGSISSSAGTGGTGSNGGQVNVEADGSITNRGYQSSGVVAQSLGGNGGPGGNGGDFRYGARGGTGGNGGQITVTGSGTIHTYGQFGSGILAVSQGGNGGGGGSGGGVTGGGNGGFGGLGGAVNVNGSWDIITEGNQAHGIWAKSVGGNAGNGGSGGWLAGVPGNGGQATDGGSVSITSGSTIITKGSDSYGLYGQSVGGFGGSGGNQSGIFYSAGGDGDSAGSGGAVSIINLSNATITTTGARGHAIFAQSIGGGGGSGGGAGALVGVGGSGGAGGNGRAVSVANAGQLQTSGAGARGIYAQSIGGGGGDGGNSGGLVGIGGSGSGTSDGGSVTVTNSGNISSAAEAIFAQSIGGGGGSGGSSVGLVSVGGSGGGGGNASTVSVSNSGQLTNFEANASAVFAQSVGGGGGNGGNSAAVGVLASVAIGGSSGAGGNGSSVSVTNSAGSIQTTGDNSRGIFAQSIGGGGGNGGYAVSITASPQLPAFSVGIGGKGGKGGTSSSVFVDSETDITTHGANSHGIEAQSVGGGGGSGGFALAVSIAGGSPLAIPIGFALGGKGGAGNDAGTVTVGSLSAPTSGTIETFGAHSDGILAQSGGGGGGDGGFSIAGALGANGALSVSLGGSGAGGGNANSVSLISSNSIITHTNDSHGLFAQSLGGGGGNGGFSLAGSVNLGQSAAVSVGLGGAGGGGGNGSNVTLKAIGPGITTFGDHSFGAAAQSIGGGGGDGGFVISAGIGSSAGVGFGLGGSGTNGGSAGNVDLENASSITTSGAGSHGLFAESLGGGGGSGGFSIGGGLSSSGAIGISIGGAAAGGGDAAAATLNSSGSNITTLGDRAYGILAQSIGGGGGDGGFSIAGAASKALGIAVGIGGSGAGGGNAGAVTVDNGSDIQTGGQLSYALAAQSIGGGGGSGGFSVGVALSLTNSTVAFSMGGSGGGGGNGEGVTVNNTGTLITTNQGAHVIMAESVGGGGGAGGFAASLSGSLGDSKNVAIAIGGRGAGGGKGGSVSVTNAGSLLSLSNSASAIFAQSVGGGGGDGGFGLAATLSGQSPSFNASVAVGGGGGTGNVAGAVSVVNLGSIDTYGTNSYGILAQSLGGGGGNGGFGVAGALSASTNAKQVTVSVGGGGGSGNDGSTVTVSNLAAITTRGLGSFGILAQSLGGGGGNGGFSFSGAASGGGPLNASVAVGGNGAGGGNGGLVQVDTGGPITTMGDFSEGIFAQSVGGGGGNGGWSAAVDVTAGKTNSSSFQFAVSVGGQGKAGGTGGAVNVRNTNSVVTFGESSQGILAQSIGGGGGKGGYSFSGTLVFSPQQGDNYNFNVAVGGSGGNGNNGGAVTVQNEGLIDTSGDGAHGIEAQSIGGGGGSAGDARSLALFAALRPKSNNNNPLNLTIGGTGGGASDGGTVGVTNIGDIITRGADAYGIFAQSIGGGGGSGGNANFTKPIPVPFVAEPGIFSALQITVGGSGGDSGNGGELDVTQSGQITTEGNGSMGLVAQSVGGGGGIGGNGETGFTGKIAIGGAGGAAGNGGNVNVNFNGGIETSGAGGYAIFAQSVGGGGGAAGDITRGLSSILNVGIGLAFGQSGGGGGNGGIVNVNSTGDILTLGPGATGIFAESVGGGGGLVGSLGNDLLPILSLVNFAGSVGAAGSGGDVIVTHTGNIMTLNSNAHGIFAQSAGGTNGSGGKVSVTVNGSIAVQGTDSDGIFAQSIGLNGNKNVSVSLTGGTVQGGSGQGVGVRIADGANNTLQNAGIIQALSGNAVVGGNGNETITNTGRIIGSVDLGGGQNAIYNLNGGKVEAGPNVNLGAGNSFMNFGLLNPGGSNTIQGVSMTANLTQTSNGIFWAKLAAATNYDRVTINGAARLDGRLTLTLFGGYLPKKADQFTVLSANNGVTGQFATLDDPVRGVWALRLQPVYSGTYALIQTIQDSFNQFAVTLNQHSVAHALDAVSGLGTMFGDPREARLITFLNTVPGTNLPAQFDLISPEGFGAMFDLTEGAANIHGRNIERRAAQIRSGNPGFGGLAIYDPHGRLDLAVNQGAGGGDLGAGTPADNPSAWNAFAIGSGQLLDVEDTANASGYDIETAGATLGADRRVGDNLAIGLTAGYVGDRAFLANNGHVTVNGGRVGAYATWFGDGPYLSGAAEGGYNFYDTHRDSVGGTATGSTGGPEADAWLGGGYDFKHDALTFGPLASVQYTYVDIESFTETGSLAPLHIENNDANSLRSLVGGRIAYDMPVGSAVIRPELQLGWQHEFLDTDHAIDSRFATGAGNIFTVNSPTIGRDNLFVSAGFAVQWSRKVGTSVFYDGELLRQNYTAHTINIGLGIAF
jgi:uncharacterized protein YhjY with autotransporter beta-barrel domain